MRGEGLILQRRHTAHCPDRHRGANYLKCRGRCPVWATGTIDGRRIRQSLRTRDLQRAAQRLAALLASINQPPRKTVTEAVSAFLEAHKDRAPETRRKYARIIGFLAEHCRREGIEFLDELAPEHMDRYAQARGRKSWGWVKELELIRQFFDFAVEREWVKRNPAKALRAPRPLEPNDVRPYTQDEIVRIIRACDEIGRTPYERLRARAMVLLMRYTGLRISDVVTLDRSHIQGRYLVKRLVKNKRLVRIELPDEVLEALERLPRPKAAPAASTLYFASGNASLRSLVKGAERTLAAVFRRAGVEGAHAHRFRHTLASELLGRGGAIEDVACILGDSPAIVRRHYAKWTAEYQQRLDSTLRLVRDTGLARREAEVSIC